MDQSKKEVLVKISSKDEKWKEFPPCLVLPSLTNSIEEIKNLKVYEDDVFLAGYPRSGTTLTKEMIWLIVNDFDFKSAQSIITDMRFPYMEGFYGMQSITNGKVSVKLDEVTRPRTMKTHFPVSFLPDDFWKVKPKLIYISRDVKDVAISTYHLCRDFLNYKVELEQFLQDFLEDNVLFAPYREHVKNYFELKDYPNVLFLTYEWVTTNTEAAIKKVAEFLGNEISEENLGKLMKHLEFESMKKNSACNSEVMLRKLSEKFQDPERKTEGLIRKGKIGGYKDEMPEHFIAKFDQWIKEPLK